MPESESAVDLVRRETERRDLVRHAFLHVRATEEIRNLMLLGAGPDALLMATVAALAEGGYLVDPTAPSEQTYEWGWRYEQDDPQNIRRSDSEAVARAHVFKDTLLQRRLVGPWETVEGGEAS